MDAFERFWAAWPSSPRKGAKSQCRAKWEKMKLDIQINEILAHVNFMKKSEQWIKPGGSFIPAPLVYINQMRWDGAEIPEEVEKVDAVQEMAQRLQGGTAMPAELRERLKALKQQTRGQA